MKKIINIKYLIAVLIIFVCAGYVGINNNILKVYDVSGTDSVTVNGDLSVHGFLTNEKEIHLDCKRGESTITLSVAASGTWYHMTNATNDLWANDCEIEGFTLVNDTFVLDTLYGHFDFSAVINFLGTANQNYKTRFYDVTSGFGISPGGSEVGGGTDIHQIVINTFQDGIQNGDSIILQYMNVDGTGDMTFKSGVVEIAFKHK